MATFLHKMVMLVMETHCTAPPKVYNPWGNFQLWEHGRKLSVV